MDAVVYNLDLIVNALQGLQFISFGILVALTAHLVVAIGKK